MSPGGQRPVGPALAPPFAAVAEPHPALRPYVRAYVEQGLDVPPGEALLLTISANTDPVGGVTWAGEVHVGLRGGFQIPRLALTGFIGHAFTNRFAGTPRGFFVRFAPVGPLALFGVRGGDYARSPAFDEVVPEPVARAVRAWGEAVVQAPDFPARVALTDSFLRARLPHVTPRASFFEAAVARIEAASGRLRVAELAAALGVGQSTLRRRFRDELGLPAKRFSEIVRFRHAHAFLRTTPEATWADAVVRFGYTDQSHLIRDYHRLAGITPTRWRPEVRFIDLNFGIQERPPEA